MSAVKQSAEIKSPLSAPDREKVSATMPVLVILAAALTLTCMLGFASSKINQQYFQTHAFRLDPSFYAFQAAHAYNETTLHSIPDVAANQLWKNSRDPLRILPVLLLSPKLLTEQVVPLVTALPCMFIFLALAGIVAQRKTDSLICGVAVMTMFATMPGLIHPTYGLGTFFLDLVAALFLGSAALCLLEYESQFKRAWLVGFAMLVSLALFSRYASLGYVAFCLVPPLFGLLFLKARKDSLKASAADFFLVTVTGLLFSGSYVVLHLVQNLFYYTKLEPGGNGSIFESANALLPEFLNFIGVPLLAEAALIALAAIIFRHRNALRSELFIGSWLMFSALALNIVIVKFVGREYNHHPILFAVPFICVGVLFILKYIQFQKHTRKLLVCSAIVVSCISLSLSFTQLQKEINTSSQEEIELKALHSSIAELLSAQPDGRFWYFFADEQSHNIQNECQYRRDKYRGFPLTSFQYFSTLPAFWQIYHSFGATTEDICRRVCAATDKWIDLVIVFDNPADAQKEAHSFLVCEEARAVAGSVAQMVKTNPHWRKIKEFSTSRYGKLAAYENLDCQGRGYKRAANRERVSP